MTIAERLEQLVSAHGSLREVAAAIGVDPGYLSRLATGQKTNPSKATLTKLGLRAITHYERLKP